MRGVFLLLLEQLVICILAFLVLSQLHGLTGHFAFATVMISLMYCFIPGSVILEPEKSHAIRTFSDSLKKELAEAKADYLHFPALSPYPEPAYEEMHEPYLAHLMIKYTDESRRLQNICQGNWKRL